MMMTVMVLLLLLLMHKKMMNFVQRVNEVHPCWRWQIRQNYIKTHLSMLLPPSPPPPLQRSHHARHFQH